jgi:hypothetical protein
MNKEFSSLYLEKIASYDSPRVARCLGLEGLVTLEDTRTQLLTTDAELHDQQPVS